MAVGEPCLLGLDLAWSPRNPSGAAALDAAGLVVDLRDDLRGDDEIVAWVAARLGAGGVIAVDMPTIVPNAAGMRPCERAIHAAYGRRGAGAYPANRSLPPFRDGGGRAARMILRLRERGVVETLDVAPSDARTVVLEVFPHAAHLELFGLAGIFRYKKKQGRAWADVLAAWAHYRSHLASLAAADPPLALPADPEALPDDVGRYRYKRWDDRLDAVTCAYVAAYVHRHGLAACRVFGDLESGYIVVPGAARFARGRPGCDVCAAAPGEGNSGRRS